MSKLIYRVEYDCENGSRVGMFLAEYHTSNKSVKTLCRKYRSRAPFIPEPEHRSFSSGIPYCISFGCETPQQLMKWFGYSKTLLRETLSEFKIRVYKSSSVYNCDEDYHVMFGNDVFSWYSTANKIVKNPLKGCKVLKYKETSND